MIDLLSKYLTPLNIIRFILSVGFSFTLTVMIYMFFGSSVTDFLMPIFLVIAIAVMLYLNYLAKPTKKKRVRS